MFVSPLLGSSYGNVAPPSPAPRCRCVIDHAVLGFTFTWLFQRVSSGPHVSLTTS